MPRCAWNLPELDMKSIVADEARGIKFSSDKRVLSKYPCTLRSAEYVIPSGVIAIKHEAFQGCQFIRSVMIPEGVMFIGDSVFSRCKKLASVRIPKSVNSDGQICFLGV